MVVVWFVVHALLGRDAAAVLVNVDVDIVQVVQRILEHTLAQGHRKGGR